jgi:hypothetical protein
VEPAFDRQPREQQAGLAAGRQLCLAPIDLQPKLAQDPEPNHRWGIYLDRGAVRAVGTLGGCLSTKH